MELWFDIGGSAVRVAAPDGLVDVHGSDLEKFSIPPASAELTLDISLCDSLSEPAEAPLFSDPERRVWAREDGCLTMIGPIGKPYMELLRKDRHSRCRVHRGTTLLPLSARVLLRAMEAEHLVAENDGILLHSSFIRWQEEALVFTAPSGTGKSTQAELWRVHRGAQVLNGDRSVLLPGEKGFQALGLPFSGSSGICHRASLPLRAVVVLSQGPENTVQPLTGTAAFSRIWEGCSFHTWNRAEVAATAAAVAALIGQVPVLHLTCTPDEQAVAALENALNALR